MPAFTYHEYPVAAALRPLLASYWCFRAHAERAPAGHAVIPDGCISLVFARAPARRPPVVLGPRATVLHVPVERATCVLGVRLQPTAGPLLLGVPPAQLRETVQPLQALAPRLADALAPALAAAHDEPIPDLDAALQHFAAGLPAPDPAIGRAVHAIRAARGQIAMSAAAAHAGLAERQFQRRFRAAVGLSFKEYARIIRFRAAALDLLIEGRPLAQLAAARGFSDQSHLIRESARLSGVSPRRLRSYLAEIEHELLVS